MRNARKLPVDCQEPAPGTFADAARQVVGEDEGSTRSQILSSAARLFRTRGYAAVSLRDIAKDAGLTTGSVYHNFASKEEIVSEILYQGHRRVLNEVRRNVDFLGKDAAACDILRTAIHTHMSCLLGEDSFPSANIRIFSHVPVEVRVSSLGARQDYESYWIWLLGHCRALDRKMPDFDVAILSNILFGAMNWTIEWFRPERHDFEQVVDNLTRLVMPDSTQAPLEPAPVQVKGRRPPRA